jgi:hypothetical protein
MMSFSDDRAQVAPVFVHEANTAIARISRMNQEVPTVPCIAASQADDGDIEPELPCREF